MMRAYGVLLLAAGAVQAQTPLLTGDGLGCFSMSGAPAANLTLVAVDGMPFARAMHVRTDAVAASANAWDIRPRCLNTAAAGLNDTVVATFWMRAVKSPAGKGYTTFVVEKGGSPYTKSVTYTATAGTEWKKFEVPFSMAENYTAQNGSNPYNFSFWVVFPNQEIEIGGLTVLDYGAAYPYSKLNLTNWPYEGHDPNAAWRQAAAERIERYRKADITLQVEPGAQVHLKMKQHAFGFGTAVAGGPVAANTNDGTKYREALGRVFNKIVTENALKWPYFEAGAGRRDADAIFGWTASSPIKMVRGHNIIWPGLTYLPSDVQTMLKATPVDKAKLRARIDSHFREVMTYAKGKLTEWDVLNEAYTNKDVQAALGDAEMIHWFQLARELDPAVKLYINDYNITESGGSDFQHQNAYFNTIKMILDGGGPIDGIGLQSHFNTNLTPPDRVMEILDRFASFGKELQVTEFDVNVKDEQAQADYTRDYLTICFSHPAMRGFMLWGFWEGAHWLPDGAMLRRDWTPRPMYNVWTDLIYKQWWTDVQGTADANGVFRARGFLGDYDAEITVNGKTRTIPLTVPAAAPKIADNGVVNAASYLAGPVAAGEAVTIFGSGFAQDAKVLFDGAEAVVLFAMPGQVSVIVPAGVRGKTRIEVEWMGARSSAVEVPVAAAAPGIYTDGSGRQALGSVTAGNVTFYLTGEGSGQAVKTLIGGAESACAGNSSAALAPGLFQVNACVPAAAPNPASLLVQIAGAASQSGVTVPTR